eukprot:4261472-Amphidinium_carterae.1
MRGNGHHVVCASGGALSECTWQWPSCGLSVRWGAISMQVATAIESVAPKNLEASLYCVCARWVAIR